MKVRPTSATVGGITEYWTHGHVGTNSQPPPLIPEHPQARHATPVCGGVCVGGGGPYSTTSTYTTGKDSPAREPNMSAVRDDIPGSRNLGSRDYWVRVRELGEWDSVLKRDQSRHGLRNGCIVILGLRTSEHGPSTEGAGTQVCGYVIKNSGLTVV